MAPEEANLCPLVVDLDGTLTPTDTLVESLVLMLKRTPWLIFAVPFWLLRGRAYFKQRVAAGAVVDAELLPIRSDLLAYLTEQRDLGRRIVLATAARQDIADRVALHLGIFDDVLATSGSRNLKGAAKLDLIHKRVGASFVYAGDSPADLPIWRAASGAIPVGLSRGLLRRVAEVVPIERTFGAARPTLGDWLKALRVHQWVKNVLLFVPLLTAFGLLNVEKWLILSLGFVAMSFVASATYVFNDLWDIESDRAHPRKRDRPFANARISIFQGVGVASGLLIVGLLVAFLVSVPFGLVVLAYLVLTCSYSWVLKEYVLLDVLMLACLYTLRIIAGAVAIEVVLSSWLLAFSVFVFLSLALIKRCAELVALDQKAIAATRGRDYRVKDLVVLWPLGVGAGLCAVVVFGLFISTPETMAKYSAHQLLWLIALGLVYWLARLWIKTSRGEMHDDPIVYALRDKGSRIVVAAIVLIAIAARALPYEWFS